MIVHHHDLEDVIHTLHETGMTEIINISKDNPNLLKDTEKAHTHPEAGPCSEYELRLTRLIDILKRTQTKPKGLKGMLTPKIAQKTEVETRTLDELYSFAESILHDIEQTVISCDEQQHEIQQKIDELNDEITQIQLLKKIDVNLNDLGTSPYLYLIAGKTQEFPLFKEKITTLSNDIELYSHQHGKGKEKEWAVVIAGHIDHKDAIDKLCREFIDTFDLSHHTGQPSTALKSIQTQISDLQRKQKELKENLSDYASTHLHDLFVIREEIKIERIRKEISKNFAKTTSTYIINAWVLAENEPTLKQNLIEKTNDSIIYESKKPSTNPDNPPTYIKIPKWAKSFNTLLELFATPRYNELNPTIPMGIFFILFFGLMLGDGGYGFVILVLSLVGYFFLGKASGMIRTFSFLGIWLGLTTTIVGLLTNSFFGDFIPTFIYGDPNATLYSLTIAGIQLPIEPLRNPLILLTIALLAGLIHMNLGIFLAILQTARNKQYKELITKHFSWILLEIGGGLLIAESLLKLITLSTMLFYIAAVFVIIGIVLRLIDAGPLGFFDITGFVGDWLSYARLLALGLATGGMAIAFNIVAQLFSQMIPIEIIGLILMGFLLILLHTINLGLQALGAGVHSLRLQYVEFFNRFYEGGGRKFKPFSIKRKYTTLKKGVK